jgi:hypothetical protein
MLCSVGKTIFGCSHARSQIEEGAFIKKLF